MNNETDFVNYFETHKLHLIRIAKRGHDAGKRPNDTGWQDNPLGYAVARKWVESGGNLGWAVGNKHLVLDIDPRNGGNESYQHLLKDLSLDEHELTASTPGVMTGSGGRHIYFSKDPEILIRPGPLRGYPGIDIKVGASQVVIPGSTHPIGLPYLVDPASSWPSAPASAPAPLVEMLAKRTSTPPEAIHRNAAALANCLTLDQCRQLLEHNDPTELEGYEQWIKRLAAIHHATGGEGLELAIEWSAKDPEYTDVADSVVRRRWDSFARPHDLPATVHTLLSDVRDVPAAEGVVHEVSKELARREFDDNRQLADELIDRVDHLPGGGWRVNQPEAVDILRESLKLDNVMQANIQRQLAKDLKIRGRELNKVVTAIKKDEAKKEGSKKDKICLDTFIVMARDKTIKAAKGSNNHIVRAPNEQYYIYTGQYWQAQSREYVTHLVHKSVQELKKENPKVKFETTGVTAKAELSLRAERHTAKTDLFLRENPPSTINTVTGTIWIDDETGEHEIKPHHPGDFLTTIIDTEYDAEATCPSFDIMLDQVFEHVQDPTERADLIRHFWELIGYAIQPRKNIPLIMLWHGTGHNGKTTIARFLQSLVGDMCALPVEMHELGTGQNAHALESIEGKLILIDDDLKSDARLSDGVLKKFSESKKIQVNPKYKAAYTTQAHVTPIILTNGYPIIRDLSEGLRRRIDVLPFNSNLSARCDSPLPEIARTREMPGILNRALEGIKRLRVRGVFERPKSSIDANARFFSESNNVMAFVKFTTSPGGTCELTKLYAAYVQYCVACGERNNTERYARFRSMLQQIGYETYEGEVLGLNIDGPTDEY